ncbi:NAD(P)-binding domain-containing protein [Streptomyces sp. NPDC006356]
MPTPLRRAISQLATAAGIDVVLSNSRGPETLAETVTELGERVRAETPEEAARAGDWVVVSIPLAAYRDLPAAGLAGKVVLDTINYYPFRDGRIKALDSGRTTTSELVQEHLSGAKLVKAFNNISDFHLPALARPAGADRTAHRRRRPASQGERRRPDQPAGLRHRRRRPPGRELALRAGDHCLRGAVLRRRRRHHGLLGPGGRRSPVLSQLP